MQTLAEIKALLAEAGTVPRRGLGQHFLIDGNLMAKLLELADVPAGATVLEVGSATGSLTEELARRAGRVVAVEVDPRLAGALQRRLAGRRNVTVLNCDVLAGKHALSEEVLRALAGAETVHLVANLPYKVAVPVAVNCLLSSWRAARAGGPVRFDRLTFTVQQELAERLTARHGGSDYGPASVMVALLSRAQPGRALPPQAFWPRPKVHSRMLRLDFDPARAAELADAELLGRLLAAAFGLRRKKLSTVARSRGFPFAPEAFLAALEAAGIDPDRRAEQVPPEAFRAAANALGRLA